MRRNIRVAYLRAAVPVVLALFTGACIRSANYYLNKGNQSAAQGKYVEAELNYRKAIRKDANLGEAFYQLGLTSLKAGKPVDGYRDLERAVQLMPSRDDVKVKLADLSVAIYLADRSRPQVPWNEAVKLSDELLQKNPKSFDALRLKGHLAAANQNMKDAEEFYSRANAAKPMEPEVVLGLTKVLFREGKSKEAEDLAMALIAKNRTYGPIYDVLVRRRLEVKDLAGAEQILKTKYANNPADAGAALELTRFYAGSSREADMKAVLQQMLDNPKAFPQAPLQVGDFYMLLRRSDEARKLYEQGARANSGKGHEAQQVIYLKRVADIWIVQGKSEEAYRLVDQILKLQPGDEGASVVKASSLIDTRSPDNIAKAIALLQPLVTKNDNNASLHYTMARALAAEGYLNAAQSEFVKASQKNQTYLEPRLALAEMAQLKGDYKTVLRYASEILQINPNLTRVRVLHAVSLINTGNSDEGRIELTKLEKTNPQDKELQLQLGMLELHDKQFKEAEEYFRKLSTAVSNDVRPLFGLTQTLAAEGQLDKAVALLAEEVKKTPNNNQLRYLYGDTAAMAGRYDTAIEEYVRLVAASPKTPQLYIALGNVYRLKGDYANALSMLGKGAALAPKDPAPVIAQAEILTRWGRTPQALQKFRDALQIAPDDPSLLNNVAYLLADTGGSLDEALKYARRALEIDSKKPDYRDTLGWIYFKQKLNDSALQVFRTLTARNPDNAAFHYHLAMVLLQKGDKSNAKAELENALSKKPSDEVRHDVETALSKIG